MPGPNGTRSATAVFERKRGIRLCRVIIDQFYSPGERLFFLSGNRPEDKALATAGTDFGHNAKALWMIRWAGLITGSAELVAFAENNARVLLPRAYLDNCGCRTGFYGTAPWMWTRVGGSMQSSTSWRGHSPTSGCHPW